MSKPASVVSLTEVRLQPVPEVVEAIEDLLARARSGKVRGIVYGAACDQDCDASAYAIGDSNIATLYLAVERVKLRLLREGE